MYSRIISLVVALSALSLNEGFVIKPRMMKMNKRANPSQATVMRASSDDLDRRDAFQSVGKILGISAFAFGMVGLPKRVDAAVGEGKCNKKV